MEKGGGDPDTTPEPPMMGGDRANTEDKTSQFDSTETTSNAGDQCVGQALSETGKKPVGSPEEPPVDWLEPLEEDYDDDDDDQSLELDGNRGAEMDNLAMENERSRRGRGGTAVRRSRGGRQFTSDEGWEDCPDLGEGWKRKVVLRRSGLSVGQSDAYYMSPKGDRLRSKIELLRCVGSLDLTNFDFKLGKFVAGEVPRRGPKRKRLGHTSPAECGFSSESSFHNEAADTGDRTYSPGPLFSLTSHAEHEQNLSSSHNKVGANIPSPGTSQRDTSSRYSPDKGHLFSQTTEVLQPRAVLGVCKRCRNSFTGKEGQTSCEKCSKACNATKDNRNIAFRKWLPCGFCRACQITEDCGVCASCRNGELNPDSRLPVRCRRRKCLCPSLKKRSKDVPSATQFGSAVLRPERRLSERLEAINTISKESEYSDSDKWSPLDDDKDEDFDDNKSLRKKSRLACGRYKGCVSKTDCGVCNFCVNKPKYGESSKKRQKCRRRQCQREGIGWATLNKPRLAYNQKKLSRRNRKHWDFEFSDNEGEQERNTNNHVDGHEHASSHYNGQPHLSSDAARTRRPNSNIFNPARVQPSLQDTDADVRAKNGLRARRNAVNSHPTVAREHATRAARAQERLRGETQRPTNEDEGEEQDGPTITQIFSLGSNDSGGVDLEPGLLQLLSALRSAVLPVLWCAILAEGPRLQLLQCSKLSSMADTAVQIEPGFSYHVTVQGQALLPTHRIYCTHPTRLTSATQVATLLQDLERYTVCRGVGQELLPHPGPVFMGRAAACEFLVSPEAKCCVMCKKAKYTE